MQETAARGGLDPEVVEALRSDLMGAGQDMLSASLLLP